VTAPRFALFLVSAAFAGFSLTVAIATPPWEANDEPYHARNVETLRRGDWYRIDREGGLETHQPPLYYLALAAYAKLGRVPSNATKPSSGRTLAEIAAGGGVFSHDGFQDRRDTAYVRRLRLPSIVLGLSTVLLTAAIAARVSSDRWTPVVAAATCAFVPRFVFLSGVINNDNLATTLGALAVFLAIALVTHTGSQRSELGLCIALGVTSGAIVLTKASAYLLLPGIVLALVLAARRGPDAFRRLAVRGAITVGIALIVGGWWLGLTTHWYGDPIAASATRDHLADVRPLIVEDAGSARALFIDLPQTFWHSFWYTSGWNQLRWSAWASLPFWGLLVAGLTGLARRGQRNTPKGAVPTLGVLAIGGPVAVFGLALTTNTSQGRIALVSLAAIAVLYALGTERWRVPVVTRFALPVIGICGIAVALNEHVIQYY
jgi:4-amino-4-deoxy-L-arabinose transferase-like glycosyltransferase